MMRERSYLTWLAACGVGAAALVGVAGLAGSDAVPTAVRGSSSEVAPGCNGTMWTTADGSRVCLQSSPFAVDPRVQRRLTPRGSRALTPTEVRRLVESGRVPAMPVGMQGFHSGSALLQVDRPCQDENATL